MEKITATNFEKRLVQMFPNILFKPMGKEFIDKTEYGAEGLKMWREMNEAIKNGGWVYISILTISLWLGFQIGREDRVSVKVTYDLHSASFSDDVDLKKIRHELMLFLVERYSLQ